MGKPFKNELKSLRATYRWARELNRAHLEALFDPSETALYVIGSGGSLSAARLAADLYETVVGAPATAVTPLGMIQAAGALRTFDALILSAGGRNRDILAACQRVIEAEPRRLAVVCARRDSPLAAMARQYEGSSVLEFNLRAGKDGFLATNSLLATAVLLTRAIGGHSLDAELPKTFDDLIPDISRLLADATRRRFFDRQTVLVLHSRDGAPCAVDLESKLTEAALARVQTSDLRNFAHGRHHWLAKRAEESAVLAIESAENQVLMRRTLALLPSSVPVLRLTTPFSGPVGTLSGLAAAFFVVQKYGEVRAIDPGRPGVPPFGRRLYNLNAFPSRVRKTQKDIERVAVRRKILAIGSSPTDATVQGLCTNAFHAQVQHLREGLFRALVLDYDGTICDREHRFGAAPKHISSRLVRLLETGLMLGVATGRGQSVRSALTAHIPRRLWKQVTIGYYNCGEVGLLADDGCPKPSSSAGPALAGAAAALAEDRTVRELCDVSLRTCQITVTAKRPGLSLQGLWRVIYECFQRLSIDGVAVLASGHSLDIIEAGASKLDLLRHLVGTPSGREVLCIGDRGRWPGNDWQLLNHQFSLSVDEVSSALDRGWNLAPPGVRGSDALRYYIDRLCPKGSGYSLNLMDRAQ